MVGEFFVGLVMLLIIMGYYLKYDRGTYVQLIVLFILTVVMYYLRRLGWGFISLLDLILIIFFIVVIFRVVTFVIWEKVGRSKQGFGKKVFSFFTGIKSGEDKKKGKT